MVFSCAYLALAWLSRSIAPSAGASVSVWLPGGLFVATLALTEREGWPKLGFAALLANLAFNLLTLHGWAQVTLLPLANAAAALVGAWLMQRFCDRLDLRSVRSVVVLVGLAGLLSTCLSATAATSIIHGLGDSAAALTWWRWWSGNLLGLLIVAPLVLARPHLRTWSSFTSAQWAEGALFVGLLGGCSALFFGFGHAATLIYVLIPFMMWASFRVGVWGVAWCNLTVCIVAVLLHDPTHAQTPPLELFLAVLALSGLSTAAAVSERNRAATALSKSQERYTLVESAANDGILDWNLADGTAYISPRARELLGYRDGELCEDGASLLSLLHPRDRANATEILRAHLETGVPLHAETRLRHKDGSYRWMLARGRAQLDSSGRPVRLTGAITDITARKEAEFEAREQQFQYHALANSGMALIWTSGPDGGCNFFNDIWLQFTGRKLEQELGSGWTERVHPDDLEHCLGTYKMAFAARQPFEMEYRLRHYSGEYRWIRDLGSPNYHSDGRFAGYIGHCFDVTQGKKATAALLTSEAELRAIYDAAPVMLALLDQDFKLVRANQALSLAVDSPAEELRGHSAAELLARLVQAGSFTTTLDALNEASGKVQSLLTSVLASHEQKERVEIQVAPRSPVASPMVLRFSGSSMELGGKPYALMCVEDLTRQKQLETQFYQTQKVEAIGQLAGGIAHDFNNILAAFMMHLSLLSKSAPVTPESAECLDELTREARRASILTKQLLTFSRRQVVQSTPVNLGELVSDTGNMLRRLLGENIKLELSSPADDLCIKADAGMIEQLVTNLCVNARDAMPHGGQLSLNIEPILIEAHDSDLGVDCRPGTFARLRVSDTGCGMNPETQKRIFEPFYTTKPQGKGTGLGLATVAGIVKLHHGWITVDSAPGQGTTFHVYLPLSEEQAVPQNAVVDDDEQMPCGKETILLVEDEPGLRRAMAQSLRRCGYAVLEADDGNHGLRLWEAHSLRIELLITDMVMPGSITGMDLAMRLRQDSPELPVIISSGYSLELVSGEKLLRSGFKFVPKPCEPPQLLKLVRELLESRKAVVC